MRFSVQTYIRTTRATARIVRRAALVAALPLMAVSAAAQHLMPEGAVAGAAPRPPELPASVASMPSELRDLYRMIDDRLRIPGSMRVSTRGEAGTMAADSPAGLAAVLYRINDFNPTVFAQYADETARRTDDYRASLRGFSTMVCDRLCRASADRGNALYSLLYADYILRVRIRLIEPAPDAIQENVRYNVTADVIDTLKGRVLPPVKDMAISRDRSPIRFAYLPGNYLDPEEMSIDRDEVSFPYHKTDPAFATPTGTFTMRPGQDAIVFLRYQEGSTGAEPILYLEPWASYNALPVIDGQVRDVNNVWSDKEVVSYGDWKSAFEELRGRMLRD